MTHVLAQRQRTDRGFERLYRHHVLDVYRYALVVLHSPEDAEDVTQTTFLNAYRAYKDGERPRSVLNWLIAIAHKICRRRFRHSGESLEDHADEAVPDDEGPTMADIGRALGRLPLNERAALVMREVEGRSYGEIAEILALPASEIETLIFRARRTLREELEGALTCHQAERAISLRFDGRLDRAGRRALRRHLRECPDCAGLARSQRVQRSALRSLADVRLPSSLESFPAPATP